MCKEGSPGSALDGLVEAAQRLRRWVTGAALEAEELSAALQRLRQVCDGLEVDFSHLAAAFAQTERWDEEGYVSPYAWLRHTCHMTGGAAVASVRVGEQAEALPRSVAAMQEGRIGFAHLRMLASTAQAVTAASGTFDETALLRRAERSTPWQFRRDCAHARHAADAAAFLEAQREQVEERCLVLRPLGDEGCLSVRGFLDAEGGLVVRTALEALARPSGVGDTREPSRRLGDALVEACAQVLDADGGGSGHHVPHLQVTTTLETLLGLPGSPAGELTGAGAPAGAGCAQPVAAATVARYACSANVRRVLLGPDSAVVDVGRERRLPAPATRRQVEQRDQGCVWPGCDRPARWTQPHHVRPWARDGATMASNLVSLCRRHHWLAHDGGWTVTRVEGEREVLAIPPLPDWLPRVRGPGVPAAS